MAKANFGSAEDLARIGLALILVSIALLQGAVFGVATTMYFWMALIILFFETFKLPSVSAENAATAEAILSATMVVGSGRGLILSMGKTFNSHHFFLIMFIIGALLIGYASYKRLYTARKR
jgi:FtsH-binding integral membrane protein